MVYEFDKGPYELVSDLERRAEDRHKGDLESRVSQNCRTEPEYQAHIVNLGGNHPDSLLD